MHYYLHENEANTKKYFNALCFDSLCIVFMQ